MYVLQKCVSKVLYVVFHMLNIGSAVWQRIHSFLCYFLVEFYFELLYIFLSWVTLLTYLAGFRCPKECHSGQVGSFPCGNLMALFRGWFWDIHKSPEAFCLACKFKFIT